MENTNQNPELKSGGNRKKYIIAATVAGVLIVGGVVFAPSLGLQGRLVKMNSNLNPVSLNTGVDAVNTVESSVRPSIFGKLGFGSTESTVEKTETVNVASVVEQEFNKIDQAANSNVLTETQTSADPSSSAPTSSVLDALRALYQNLDGKLNLIANQNARIEYKLDAMIGSFNNYTAQWNNWRFDNQSEESWKLFVSQWKGFMQDWVLVTR